MLQRLKKFFTKTLNDTGSVLSVSIILLVIVSSTAAAITSVTINQSQATTVKVNYVNEEVTLKRLIQQAISEYENFMTDDVANNTFDDFDNTLLPSLISKYSIDYTDPTKTDYPLSITNVTDQVGFESFGITVDGESRVYRFAYTLGRGMDLVMYSYISTTGSSIEEFEPFGFSVGTNGDLILTGGSFTHANIFANNMYVNFRGPYENRATSSPTITPATSGGYPDYQANGDDNEMFIKTDYEYCTGNCFTTSGTYTTFTIDTSLYEPIENSTNIETGDYDQAVVINNFFGNFSLEDTIESFLQDDAPTDGQTFSTAMNYSNFATVVAANSSIPVEQCTTKGKKTTCVYEDSGDLFTDITNDIYFDPESDDEILYFSGYHNGNLTIQHDMEMDDIDTDALIVDGDLTINNVNNQGSFISANIVVLGDLYFTGNDVEYEGALYVTGQVFFDFNENEGLDASAQGNQNGISILAHDHIIFNSFRENHTSGQNNIQFDAFIYTDESIFIDAVNNCIDMNGSLFANAKGESGTTFPIENASGFVNGIVITSYQGYINNSGSAVPSTADSRHGFQLTVINSIPNTDSFFEIPVFESFVTIEGSVGTPERSEFTYE